MRLHRISGGTGHWPVRGGNLPPQFGTSRARTNAIVLGAPPAGGSPAGTGQWPVPPGQVRARLLDHFHLTMPGSPEKPQQKDHWFRDWWIYGGTSKQVVLLPLIIFVIGLTTQGGLWLFNMFHSSGIAGTSSVVVYTSQDQIFAEPIFREFTKQTGLEVRAVYDSEAVKTVGLANRLIAEKSRPQCDLFWNNEELRTVQLVEAGVLADGTGRTNFAMRMRQLVVRSDSITDPLVPLTLDGLTNSALRGKVALAYPLFGTTSAHFLALREKWGAERWDRWCRALAANQPLLVDGNSVVVKLVAGGQALVGLTDSDDVRAMQREGKRLLALGLTGDDDLMIRNTVALVRGGPNPDGARKLMGFLSSKKAVEKMVEAGAVEPESLAVGEMICGDGRPMIPADWSAIAKSQAEGMAKLKEIFLR